MQLSVIVSIFNKSEFLPALFKSLLNQGLSPDEFEILLINDGSTDNSEQLCNALIQDYPKYHIQYVFQENAGVSAARNKGIELAQGNYIHFVDADDSLLARSYHYLLDLIGNMNADYVGFGIRQLDMRAKQPDSVVLPKIEGELLRETSRLELMRQTKWPSSSIAGFYRRKFLLQHNVKFPLGILTGEDVWFNYDFFKNNPRCLLTSCCPYVYWLREGSIMTTITEARADRWFNSYYLLLVHLSDNQQITPPTQYMTA